MTSTIVTLPVGNRRRVLIAHRRDVVRHALRTLIEAENVQVVEAADGDAALEVLAQGRFDLLVLELDLPGKDGVTLTQFHRLLLAHERLPIDPPAVIHTLAPEVRGNATLAEYLRSLGIPPASTTRQGPRLPRWSMPS